MRKRPEWIDKGKKLFVLNTCKKLNTLHINDGRCRHIQGLYDWADFETEAAAVRYTDNNLKRCAICFPKE